MIIFLFHMLSSLLRIHFFRNKNVLLVVSFHQTIKYVLIPVLITGLFTNMQTLKFIMLPPQLRFWLPSIIITIINNEP